MKWNSLHIKLYVQWYQFCLKNVGTVVNNIVITLHGDRWLLNLVWGSHPKVYKCQLTIHIPETNTILYANRTLVKNKKYRYLEKQLGEDMPNVDYNYSGIFATIDNFNFLQRVCLTPILWKSIHYKIFLELLDWPITSGPREVRFLPCFEIVRTQPRVCMVSHLWHCIQGLLKCCHLFSRMSRIMCVAWREVVKCMRLSERIWEIKLRTEKPDATTYLLYIYKRLSLEGGEVAHFALDKTK